MRYALQPIGFPVTKMRKGKWNYPMIFKDVETLTKHMYWWFVEVLEYAPFFLDEMLAMTAEEARTHLDSLNEVQKRSDSMYCVRGLLDSEYATKVLITPKGYFVLREF